jgi:phosphonate transport system substrate-binding protein
MPSNRWIRQFIVIATAVIAGMASPRLSAMEPDAATSAPGKHEGALVIGRVSNNPRKDYPALRPLGDYLAGRLASAGIDEAQLRFVGGTEEMTELLRNGEVDVALDTVFPALSYSSGADAKLLLREWRDGAPNYRSILFKRTDTPVHDLADLVGRTLAFERPGSTTAYFVPKAELMAAGLQLRELAAPKQPPPRGSVGYVFAGSENNLVVWVHRGLVAAGAFSDIDWEQSEDMPPELKDDFEIFYRSAPLPRALVVVRPGLPPLLEEQIKQALLAADTDAVGMAALKARKVTRYDELIGEAAAGVEAARRLVALTN